MTKLVRIIYRLIFVFIFLFPSINSEAQFRKFRNLSASDGLNNGTINSITPSPDGPIWFATWDGLIRYDGYNYKTYFPIIGDTTSIPAKQCQSSFLDSNGELWVSTKAGISKYNREQDNFYRYILPGFETNKQITYEFTEFREHLFVSAFEGIYYHSLDKDNAQSSKQFKQLEVLGIDGEPIVRGFRNFSCIADKFVFTRRSRDEFGRLRAQTYFARLENLNEDQFRVRVYSDIFIPGIPYCFEEKDESIFYIGTNRGVMEYNTDTQKLTYLKKLRNIKVNALFIDSKKNLWIGTGQSGLIKYSEDGQITRFMHDPTIQNSLIGNNILSITEDFSKNLWLGMDGQGISVLNLVDKGFNSFRYDPSDPFSLKDNTVFCFSEIPGEILIGTKEEGLLSVKVTDFETEAKFTSILIPFLENDEKQFKSVWDIQKEDENIYWFGTNYGLIRGEIVKSKWEFSHFISNQKTGIIRKIFIDKDRNIWAGTYNGLFVLPSAGRESNEFYHFKSVLNDSTTLSDDVITSFLLDTDDNFWIGTQEGGVNKLKVKYGNIDFSDFESSEIKFDRFTASESSDSWIKTNEINCLFQYYDGSIWAGTQGAGINILHPKTGKTETLKVSTGLGGRDIFGIVPAQDGNLWISTNQGLSSYHILEKKFTNYSTFDGIQGSIFMVNSYFKASNNYFYFGGRNGFTRFHPNSIYQNTITPSIFLTDLQIYQKTVNIGEKLDGKVILEKALNYTDEIVLSHKESDLSIYFAAIHFEEPDENMVEYMLEGFDYNFTVIPAKQGFVRYTNLNAGVYTFRLRAGNSDAFWMDNYKELIIRVNPPWWLTIVAKLGFLVLLILAFSGITYLLLHRERLRHSLSIEKVEKKTLTELNESKLRFFTNISHEFRTPLTLILGPLEASLKKIKDKDYFLTKQLNTAVRNSNILLRLVNQIIDFRQLEAGKLRLNVEKKDVGKFVKEVLDSFDSMRNEKNISLELSIPEHSIKIYFDPSKLEQIIYNLLSNAIKYTYRDGHIMISCELEKKNIAGNDNPLEYFCFHVFNDGNEIPEDKQEVIFERFYTLSENNIGSGIGLGLTRSLVELHKGHMSLDSGIGKGNTFSIFIPTNLQASEDHTKLHDERENISGNRMILSETTNQDDNFKIDDLSSDKPRLLFIDDNSELRSFFKSSLSENFIVILAENGKEGITKTNEEVPDIIICDISMPEMDGIEFCEKVKENEPTSHIPIILLTAKDSPDFKISGYKAGADGYVVKPFRIDVLKAHIEQLLLNRDKIRENYKNANYEILGKAEKTLSKDDKFLKKVKEIIEENILNPEFNVGKLAENLNIGTTQLYRKIKALTGYSSIEFVNVLRLVKAAELLKTQEYSIKEVSYMTGFNSPSYFVKCFREKYNLTPNSYQQASLKNQS